MTKNESLSLRNQWLGARLRAARTAAGFTLKSAGAQLQLADATLSRFEKGVVRVRRVYVKEMIDLYGVSNANHRAALLQFSEDAWRKDWWDGDSTDLEIGFLDYTWLESRAQGLRAFTPLLIHGLAQTPDYARAVAAEHLDGPPSLSEANRLVEVRMRRQRILHGANPIAMSTILGEPAIKRPVGGNKVHRQQLQRLIDLNENNTMELRLLPMSAPWDPGHGGPFTYFKMPDPFPEVAYVENLAGRTFIEDSTKVDRFRLAYERLTRAALTPQDTVDVIHRTLKEM